MIGAEIPRVPGLLDLSLKTLSFPHPVRFLWEPDRMEPGILNPHLPNFLVRDFLVSDRPGVTIF